MRKLAVFNHISLDGYFVDGNGEMSWAKAGHDDVEWDAFVAGNASSGGLLLLGRITYDLMAGFWPTPFALETMPVVAERMNNLPKVVFSRTMDQASWHNTTLVKSDLVAAVQQIKQAPAEDPREDPGEDLVILGSGTIVSQLAQAGLIDEYQLVVNPIVLGEGRTMFDGVKEHQNLKLTQTRAFANGNVLLRYEPVA